MGGRVVRGGRWLDLGWRGGGVSGSGGWAGVGAVWVGAWRVVAG